jgi:hypothetical protein
VARNYGDDAKVDGNKIKYTDENGDEKEIELTDEQFKEQYAAMKASDKMAEAISNLPKAVAHAQELAGEAAGKSLAKIYDDTDGKALTQKDLQNLESMKLSESTGDLSEDAINGRDTARIWNNLTEQEKEFCSKIALLHHKRIDGGGYPKTEDDIPLYVQLISILDAFDALTSERCYQKSRSREEALTMIRDGKCGGKMNEELIEKVSKFIDKVL